MSTSSTPTRDHAPERHRVPEAAASEAPRDPALTPVPVPTYAPAILRDPRLHGRGNGAVRQVALLQLQRTLGNQAARRMLQRAIRAAGPAPPPQAVAVQKGSRSAAGIKGVVIQRMKEADARALYKRVNQKTNSAQKQQALQRVALLKQARNQDWADYCRHNNLTAEGLPRGEQTLGMFGRKQQEKAVAEQEMEIEAEPKPEPKTEGAVTATTPAPANAWAQLYQSGSKTLDEYLTPASKRRLAKKYGADSPVYQRTLAARSEEDIQKIAASIFPVQANWVYKGDIGEVLVASAKQAAGWHTTTHQFDSTEPGLDVVSFAPPPNYHIVITEAKYWPSGLGIFDLKSLPVAYQAAMFKQNVSVIKAELIELLKTRGELGDIYEAYMHALHGAQDVAISWEIEIIGDPQTKIAPEVAKLAEQHIVSLVKYESVTARLTFKAPTPQATQKFDSPLHKLPGAPQQAPPVVHNQPQPPEPVGIAIAEAERKYHTILTTHYQPGISNAQLNNLFTNAYLAAGQTYIAVCRALDAEAAGVTWEGFCVARLGNLEQAARAKLQTANM
jgi:hypothetical protein